MFLSLFGQLINAYICIKKREKDTFVPALCLLRLSIESIVCISLSLSVLFCDEEEEDQQHLLN